MKLTASDLRRETWYLAAEDEEQAEHRAQKKLEDTRRGTVDRLPDAEVVVEGTYIEETDRSILEHEDRTGPVWEVTFYPEGRDGGDYPSPVSPSS